MYERRNAYLKRREERREERDYSRRRDMRNDYMRRDMRRDYRNDIDHMSDYRRDYENRDYDYRPDYRDDYYNYDRAKDEYEMDLKKWIEKLKSKDRFGVSKQQVLEQAKNMGVKFDEYDEMEFYAVYLAMISDYKSIANDYNMYIKMAKDFLEDDDIAVSPSEKVCIYLYQIVLGEE